MKNILWLSSIFILILVSSCDDGSIIGNEILEDENINIQFVDDFELTSQTVFGDSVQTFTAGIINQTYLLGNLDDPIYGKADANLLIGIQFGAGFPNFTNSVIDSIVLEIDYDSLGFYGFQDATYDIEVFRVLEDFIGMDSIFSSETFETEMMPLGSMSLVPNRVDSTSWQLRDTTEDIILRAPRLSIPLSNEFGTALIEDSLAATSDLELRTAFKGLFLKATTSSSSMIGLNFAESRAFSQILGKIAVYYTQTLESGLELKNTYNYLLRGETANQFILDYNGSDVELSLIHI